MFIYFFFFNDTATTEIYTLSLHDALPIYIRTKDEFRGFELQFEWKLLKGGNSGVKYLIEKVDEWTNAAGRQARSEEHTSELQSPDHLVCRLLLEKKKTCILQYAIASMHTA